MTPAVARTPRVRIRTHAKVNLFLRVLGRRPDGYHEIETILHGIGLADELDLEATSSQDIVVDMTSAGDLQTVLPGVDQNLARLAAELVRARLQGSSGASIRVRKHIPIGAGLGGGSGNAAGVLVALNELWDGHLDTEELSALARDLGSDVPYCLSGGTALATSRGEMLTPLVATNELWLVLGLFREPMLTRDVYEAWRPSGADRANSASMVLALGAGDVGEVASLLHNDLESVAFGLRPRLAPAKSALLAAGALGACLSGSGPTLFGIARDRAGAHDLASRVESVFDRVEVTSTHATCIERLDG